MRLDKREFVREFSQVSCPGSNGNKGCMIVNESWPVAVCMRVFSILMSWSNGNKSCMRVDDS